MAKSSNITAEYVRQILDYNPETGEFFWKSRSQIHFTSTATRSAHHACANWNARYAGKLAGNIGKVGYRRVSIGKNQFYTLHRLAWLLVTGEMPRHEVDHINGARADNRWSNIRAATREENSQNLAKRSDNSTGFTGVCWNKQKGKWQANIQVDGKHHSLGLHSTPEAAHDAYLAAKSKLHGFQPKPR